MVDMEYVDPKMEAGGVFGVGHLTPVFEKGADLQGVDLGGALN